MRIGLAKRRRTSGAKLKAARLRAARRNVAWTELDQVDLVPRPNGVLVSVDSDAAYLPHPGVVWERASSAAIVATHARLFFYADRDSGDLVFVERMPLTWSEQVARQARRAVRAVS